MADSPAGDPCKGAQIFRQRCAQCHTTSKDEDDKAGPHLFDLFHRGAAGATGYDYSLALQDKGMQWAEGSLFVFLENPKKSVPGIRMLFPGLKQSSDRYDLIAHLKDVTKRD